MHQDDTPHLISPNAGNLNDQDEKGSLGLDLTEIARIPDEAA
jgi:hypothetical protein